MATLKVGSQSLTLGSIGAPVSLQLAAHDPVLHEYQMDGTDSTNNYTLDPSYFDEISTTPYYQFQAWMRNLDGTSCWSDLHVYLGEQQVSRIDWPENGLQVALSAQGPAAPLRVQIALRRPETPMTLNIVTSEQKTIGITVNRNDRKVEVTSQFQGKSTTIASMFFPEDIIPFAAMLADTLIRVTLWAMAALLFVALCEVVVVFLRWWLTQERAAVRQDIVPTRPDVTSPSREKGDDPPPLPWTKWWQKFTRALHPVALLALVVSFGFVSWISAVQYNGEPHIYDASAYLFAAKMYASGHLSVPLPTAVDRFPGPFMLQSGGQWFGQYAPGTALTLVPGIWLGVPWLTEPLLGTLALLGIGLLAARLYGRRVATLAVILGTLSPFYSYLAASYLSHAVTLFYLVWGTLLFVRFLQKEAWWNLPGAALLFGMAGLTRDQVTVLFVASTLLGVLLLSWRQWRQEWRRWVQPGLLFLAILYAFVCITLIFNAHLTHDPTISPRLLFFSGDRWGFGKGIGFYGQHTIAAGLVNLDELLTILSIDLYGWPFYLTLAFVVMPFLTRKAIKWDWLLVVLAIMLVGAYVGYFYHGIYLGPRYLFEALPFLLILSARGILTLAEVGNELERELRRRFHHSPGPLPQIDAEANLSPSPETEADSVSGLGEEVAGADAQKEAHTAATLPLSPPQIVNVPTTVLVLTLVFCNLLYFLPRQIQVHTNYSGLPYWYHIQLGQIYHTSFHNAIVVTDDYTVYQFVLFPLNDPQLQGDVLYAYGSSPTDYEELQKAFPGRKLLQLKIADDGSVQYTVLSG